MSLRSRFDAKARHHFAELFGRDHDPPPIRGVQQNNDSEQQTCSVDVDQCAECDVIETVRENVHGIVPAMPKVARCGHSNVTERRDRTTLPRALVRRSPAELLRRA